MAYPIIPNNLEDEIIDIKSQSMRAKLKRLFSTDTIIRNVGGRKLKRKDTDNIQMATDKNSLRDRFNRIRATSYNAYTRDFALSYQASRMDLFRDYDTMDMDPIINSALDIYSDESLTLNEMGQLLTVHSTDSNIKGILYNLFYDILNIEGNLWSWTRNMCKYGDFFLKLYVTPEYGVYMVEPITAYNVERIENTDPYNKRYVKFQIRPTDTSQGEVCEKHEIAHFRLLSDSNFLPYGRSMIEGARRVWKQLSLLEDAMLIHRIMRAPERRIFKIDVANIPPNEIDNFMEDLANQTKKVPYMDENTGEYNLRFNLMNMVEDIYIPVRGGDSGTEIDTLSGMDWTGTEDLEYVRNKLMAALKIPKAFLGYDETVSGKATLASEDIRFGRTIQRIQRIILSELSKIAVVHLFAQGYQDEQLVDFDLKLTNPSTIFEKEQVDLWADKVAVAQDMMDSKLFSKKWVYNNIFHVSDDDTLKMQDEIVEDAKQNFRYTSIEEQGNDPAKPFKKIGGEEGGGGESDLGGPDLGGGLGGPGGKDELGGEGPPEGAEEKLGAGDLVKEEDDSDRDQTGRKDSNDYPFGEDPLGTLENNRKIKFDRDPKSRPISPLGEYAEINKPFEIDAVLINSMKEAFGNKIVKKEKPLKINKKVPLLSESNIIDE